MDQELSSAPPRIAVTQHLDALHMYDAAYHQRRMLDEEIQEEDIPSNVKPRLVTWGVYVGTVIVRASVRVVRRLRSILSLTVIGLMALNITINVIEWNASQQTYDQVNVLVNAQDPYIPNYDYYSVPHIVSKSVPMPSNWMELNLGIYISLLVMLNVLRRAGRKSASRTQDIIPVLPATRANMLQLTAEESLVRSSARPTDADTGVLLRAATYQSETPVEHLVRPSGAAE